MREQSARTEHSAVTGNCLPIARLLAAAAIALFLLYMALLPAPPLPHAASQIVHAVIGASTANASSRWIAALVRKLGEASLYAMLALLIVGQSRFRWFGALSVGLYALLMELLRPLHSGRAFPPCHNEHRRRVRREYVCTHPVERGVKGGKPERLSPLLSGRRPNEARSCESWRDRLACGR